MEMWKTVRKNVSVLLIMALMVSLIAPVTSSAVMAEPAETVIVDAVKEGSANFALDSKGKTVNLQTLAMNSDGTPYKLPYGADTLDFNPGAIGQYAQYAPKVTGEYDIYLYVSWANPDAFSDLVNVEIVQASG